MKNYRIASLPGDGIGLEIMPVAHQVLDAAAKKHGFEIQWQPQKWGSSYYRENGRMMPKNALEILSGTDAIFLGAVGDPEISDVETLWGMLIPIRRAFNQYINLRPISTLNGVVGPLRNAAPIDLIVVRENVEGEYSEVGGRSYQGEPEETAYQQSLFSRRGVSRVAEYAMKLCKERTGHLISATKSNGIIHTMTFWDEVVQEILAGYPEVALEPVLIDALAARVVLYPQQIDVIVASNLFGDIISDLAAAVVGSVGIAPSGNINPERMHPSMFEPVHGTAPDIAGKGIANPLGQIWAGAMMLDHLGEGQASADIKRAFAAVLEAGIKTGDLGGSASTVQFGDAVTQELEGTPLPARRESFLSGERA